MELNLFEIILSSGWVVKFVLLLLIAASVLSWAIVFQKFKVLKQVEAQDQKFWNAFESGMSLTEVSQLAKEYPESALGIVYHNGQTELKKISEKIGTSQGSLSLADYFAKYGLEPLERALKKGMNNANDRLEQFLTLLASVGSVTPFVGLFGTVWGIIDSFRGLSSGGGTIEAVAPGIAEALVATAVGLAAAIPAVWFFNLFNQRIAKINTKMESFSQDYINLVSRSILIGKKNPVE